MSLVLSAALAAFGKWFGGWLPAPEVVLQVLEFLISFAVITGLFAMIFKTLPDAQVAWRDVWVGATLTAMLFTVGKFAIGLYLGKSDVGSAYGAAGSLVILLVWVYYSAQILLFGAEFTEVYANAVGSRIVPSKDAVVTDPKKSGSVPCKSPQDHDSKEAPPDKKTRDVRMVSANPIWGTIESLPGQLWGQVTRVMGFSCSVSRWSSCCGVLLKPTRASR